MDIAGALGGGGSGGGGTDAGRLGVKNAGKGGGLSLKLPNLASTGFGEGGRG